MMKRKYKKKVIWRKLVSLNWLFFKRKGEKREEKREKCDLKSSDCSLVLNTK